jgi:RNA polymerase sigma factor (sigma-70 family)
VADLEALYREEYPGLVRLARLLLGTATGGEDLVQDVFVRVAARPGGLDDLENPRAFLRTAVVNACRSEQRHQSVVRRREPRPPEPELPAYLGEFADALAALPERQRAAIVLRHHLDLADDDIAALLGCRRSTVRSLVKRGLASLREVIEP